MKITYFYRNHKVGYSIKKVSDIYVNQMEDKEIFEMPCQYASLGSILKNMWFTFKHRNKTGINHITGDIHYCIIPLMFCKTVLTIHDTVAYDNYQGFKKLILKYLWFIIPLHFASKIVCISDNTKKSISKFTNRNDIQVIPNAIAPDYIQTQYTFHKEIPDILVIGTNWNKNIDRTIEAIKDIKCKLTIIGKLTSKQEQTLKSKNIIYTNRTDLTDEEIKQEYINCDMVCFCSIYEGFGMPIVEANAIGRPVITSNIAPMNDIAGESGLLVNPYQVKDIHDKILQYITNSKLRQIKIQKGFENVKKYKLSSVVSLYRKIYEQLLNQK